MNKCYACGCVFTDEEAQLIPVGNGDGENHWTELHPACPNCGNPDFEDLYKEENENETL